MSARAAINRSMKLNANARDVNQIVASAASDVTTRGDATRVAGGGTTPPAPPANPKDLAADTRIYYILGGAALIYLLVMQQ